MERKRQIPQDLNHIQGTQVQLGEHSMAIYDVEDVAREVEIPSRVEGRTVRRTMNVPLLVKQAEYADPASYLYERTQQYLAKEQTTAENGWTLEDIPAEVNAECDAYMTKQQAHFADWQQVVEQRSQAPVDRMNAIQTCPSCRGSEQYLCYTCGTARKIYTYPLVRLRDPATSEIYEVPFDAALYSYEHPHDPVLRVNKTIDSNGRLSATYGLRFNPEVFTAQYIEQATGGTVTSPKSGLVYADGSQFYQEIELAHWSENANMLRCNERITSSEELLDDAQRLITRTYGERAEDIDYNALLTKVQRKLGEHSLSLFYHWRPGGMGDWDVIYSARKNEAEKSDLKVHDAMNGDAYSGLIQFAQNLQQSLPAHEQWQV